MKTVSIKVGVRGNVVSMIEFDQKVVGQTLNEITMERYIETKIAKIRKISIFVHFQNDIWKRRECRARWKP